MAQTKVAKTSSGSRSVVERVDRGVGVGVADRHAAEDALLVGRAHELADGLLVDGPRFLRTRVEARLLGEQHERLQEHAEVRPLRRAHDRDR